MMLDMHDVAETVDITIWDAMSAVPDQLSKVNLCVDLQHVGNNKIAGWHRVPWLCQHSHVIVECEDPTLHHPNIVFYDFLWNRSKAYYTQRQWNYRPWYLYELDNFLLQDISTAQEKTRLFLSPNKHNTDTRRRLAALTAQHIGYANGILESNYVCPTAQRVDQLPAQPSPVRGYSPVHNAYYRETFFSVYVESIDSGNTLAVTEKTLDPLIKGHFVLPFSASGFVKYLISQGWQLPNFIDYSYDSIVDDQKRFAGFAAEFQRLCSLDLDTWRQLWLDNQHIIQYNRDRLYNRPYHTLEILNNANSTAGP